MSNETHPSRPSPESRRQQILDAACERVRQSGFHGASMADIAKAAGLSVGQIYRYFENKEAIIAAIVAQDLAEMRDKFAEIESRPGALLDAIEAHLPEGIDKCFDPRRATLALEVVAEAARNPKVAAIVRAAAIAVVIAASSPACSIRKNDVACSSVTGSSVGGITSRSADEVSSLIKSPWVIGEITS